MPASPSRIVVLAPNWLGDARDGAAGDRQPPRVAARRRTWRSRRAAARAAAARWSTASTRSCRSTGRGGWRSAVAASADARRLADGRFDVACCCRTRSARRCSRGARASRSAGAIARDLRGRLLTRASIRRRPSMHHAEYYLALVAALGAPASPPVASLRVRSGAARSRDGAAHDAGWRGEPIVAFAPGAAFGTAKRWPPDRVGAVAASLARERAGSARRWSARAATRNRCDVYTRRTHRPRAQASAPPMIDLTGRHGSADAGRRARAVRRGRLERFGRDAPGGGGRRAGRRHFRADQRAANLAAAGSAGAPPRDRRGRRLVPAVRAAAVPARSPLHDEHFR